jgi:hypothetical protein
VKRIPFGFYFSDKMMIGGKIVRQLTRRPLGLKSFNKYSRRKYNEQSTDLETAASASSICGTK